MGFGWSEKDWKNFLWGIFGMGAVAGLAIFVMLAWLMGWI
jgi:hypothetical protein